MIDFGFCTDVRGMWQVTGDGLLQASGRLVQGRPPSTWYNTEPHSLQPLLERYMRGDEAGDVPVPVRMRGTGRR